MFTKKCAFIFPILIVLVLCSCCIEDREDLHEVARNVGFEFSEFVPGYDLIGFGGIRVSNENNYHLSYRTYDTVNIDEARERIVNFTEKFFGFIDSSRSFKYRDYQSHFYITLAFFSTPAKLVENNHVANVELCNGYLQYYVWDSKKLKLIFREPYKEAHEKFIKKDLFL